MNCKIPYIQNQPFSETEKERLEKEHISIFSRAKQSGAFREYDKQLYAKKNDINPSREFISQINTEYGKSITKMVSVGNGNQVLSVDVLPLSNEKQVDLFFNLPSPQVNFLLKSVQILQSPKADVILPIGTSGSGKSTFIKSLPQENLVVIEPDAMRVEFTGDINDKSKDKEIYEEAAKRAIAVIKANKPITVETLTPEERERYYKILGIKKSDGTEITLKDINENPTVYQLPQDREQEEFVASEKTIRDLAARMSDRIGIPVRFESDRTKEYKGKLENGVAYVNLAYATLDTPFHEILGHPIIRAIKDRKHFDGSIDKYNDAMVEFEEKNPDATREEAIAYADKKVGNSQTNLYQNLLKELEYGKGKEVLDRVKRDYVIKDLKYTQKGQEVYKNGRLETAFFNEADAANYIKEKSKYTLEEQQEEAIVELLGLMTAEKLDAVKDGKLISLLKRLLKEIKAFVRDLLKQREVEIDKLPDNMTLGDIADLLAYSNSKLILPGNEVVYTTPDNEKFKTYQEASNHISKLAKSVEDVDLSNVKVNNFQGLVGQKDKINNKIVKSFVKNEADYEDGTPEYYDITYEDGTKQSVGVYEINQHFNSQNLVNYIKQFIEKNKEYEQSKEIIEEWKKVNNIQYNPEEVYSRGQEFVSVVGAYSDFDVTLMMQNLLQHIEDNQKAGGEFTISAFTKPVDRKIGHLEGGGGKIKFKIYPQSNDIKWASNTDVYSGSVWDASEKVNKDKKSELLGVSYTKYPSLRNVNKVQPNLANIIANLAHHHNELGIELTGSNFRLEYDENIPYSTKKIIDSINSILDQKYGKLVKPEISQPKTEKITLYRVKGEPEYFNTREEAQQLANKLSQIDYMSTYVVETINVDRVAKQTGIQPTQTNETLKESIGSVKNKLDTNWILEKPLEEGEKLVIKQDNFFTATKGKYRIYLEKDGREITTIGDIVFNTKEEGVQFLNSKKEYTSQALINIKISVLKEVAKKYPRSLIRSEVRPISSSKPISSSSNLGFVKDELPFQKLSKSPKEVLQEKLNEQVKNNKQVVFDTTNLTKEKRLPFIEAIKKAIPAANIQYKLMELNPELAKQRIKAQIARGENRANVPDSTIDRHAESYKQMLEDIKSEPISNFENNIVEINQLKQELERVETEGFGALKPIYNFYENTVTNILNKTYGKDNVKQITDEYGNTWQQIDLSSEYAKQQILLQTQQPKITPSPQVVKLAKELIERMGVDYQKVNNIVINGVKINANGIANILKGLIEVVEGKESEALPEEAMHFAVEIIEQKNPKLFNKMLTEIGDFPIYKQVLSDYSNDSNYQIDGKPNIRKLKKEAIAKQLVNTIINKVESSNYSQIAKTQNWWSEILQFIKNLFGQSGFDQAAMDIISGKEIGTIEDIRNKSKTTSEQLYLQQEAKKYAAQEIAEQFKSKEKPNERKFNRPTNLPEGFRVLQRTGINQYSTLLSSGGNTGDLREVQSRSPQSLSYYEGVFGRNFKSIFSVQNGGSIVERRKQRYGNLRVIQSLLENKLFRELASRLKLEEIRIVKNDNGVPNRSLFIKPGESILYINEDELLTNLQEKFNRGINLDEYIDLAVFEEMIHIIATKIHSKTELDQAAIEFISQDSEQLIDKFYQDVNPQQSILFKSQPYNIINELIRMKVQKDLAGKSTEDIANKSFIDNVVTKIWDFIMGLFKNNLAKTNKIAENVKDYILGKEDFDINNIDSNEILGLPSLNIQDNIINKFKEIASQVEKRNEEGYFINGVKVNRVTDIIKNWFDRRFDERKITNSEYDNALDDLKAETGTKYHNYIEKAGEVFVDKDGNLRERPLEDQDYVDSLPVIEAKKYLLLKENLKQRLDSFEPGTKFLFEQIVYDSNRKLAGTIDFIAITPNGEVSILDWKFMSLNTQTYKDVPWYKIDGWNRQMEQYKLIVSKVYGVKNEDFKQTRMIPFRVDYLGGDRRKDILPSPQSIEIGNINVQDIEEDYLLPVPLRGETTGDKTLDSLIEKLNSVYDSLSQKKVTEADKKAKAEQLNSLFSAIRQLQVKQNLIPLIQQAKILNKGVHDLLKKYSTKFEGKGPRSFTEDEINDFAHDINVFQEAIENYVELDTELDYLFENKELTEFDKLVKQELEKTVKAARKIKIKLSNIDKEFADKFVAGYEQVQGSILNPEKIVQWLPKMFSSTSTLQIKTLEVFFKKINRALFFAQKDAITETQELLDLQKNYEKWATSKNISKKNYFDILKKKDKNELIDQYQKEFYKELKDKIKDKDIKWIKDNINVEEYQKYLDKELKKELKRIEDKPRFGSESDIDTQKSIEKTKAKREYSIDNIDSLGLLSYSDVKKFPISKWETKEWKELNKPENKAALDFYDYIIKRNEYYASLGYIQGGYARKFLPFVRKGIIEKLITNPQGIRLGEDFLRSISIDEGDIGYGKIDPITGETVKSIPKYFTREVDGELSNDLFRTMALYNEAALKYEYLSKIEDSVRSLQRIEKNKKSILTSKWGKSQVKDGQIQYNPDNTQNSEILDSMVNAILYGQKYPENEGFDLLMGKIGGFGKTINDKLGIRVFPEQFEGKQISMTKMIDQLNNTFQLTALGLNPLPSISNFFGGNFQSVINAGKYFTKTDFIAAELGLLANKLTGGEDQKKLIGALSYFLPLTENYNQHIAKQLSLNTLSQENIQEFLMVLMRKSDWVVQTASFYAYLKNSAVVDGKVVNTREYLRNQPEFKDSFFKGTSEQRKEIRAKFEEAVKKLNEEKGVLKLAEIKDNKFVIPGLDNKDISVIELRRNVQQLAKDALGNLSSDDLRKINLTIYGKSFMVFKNWIPRLVDVRMGNLKFNSASDAYEWGRTRLVFRLLTQDTLKTLKSLKGALTGNGDLFISQIKDLYEKKKAEYEADTGKTLNMSEDMFIELVQKNIKNQLLDTIFMLSLLGLFYGLKAAAPEDDEDPAVKNSYRFMVKAVDKIKDELAYFYNPTSITSMVSSGVFPAVSWITNAEKLISNFGKETFAISTGNTELEEDTYVIKYLMKSFPISNQASQLLPIFYEDLAKDLGIKMSTEARAGAR